ncbi:MAG: tetratricopeptide repeat protein [Spirochaetales bacterium]|uniref:Tetratricopeptide repeat protein n=1 Tax=Candidatus Thalassospirochaeta sargassi TaxID=3119039 RepID=A0AAJ1MHF8_9SPIO|nr:tetratricopeptide repeat protein [Spirochaetales bacterium]
MKRITLILLLIILFVSQGFGADQDLFREAEGRYKSGNYAAALDLYTRFIESNRISPDAADAQFKRAVCLYQLKKPREAFKLFGTIRKSYASTAYITMVPFWQGRISLELGDYESAAGYFNEYIGDGSSLPASEAYLYRAMSYMQMGRAADAAYSLELLLERQDFTDDGYITTLLGSIYLTIGNYKELLALSSGADVRSFEPEYRNRIRLYEAEGRYGTDDINGAQEIYSELVELDDPDMSIAWQRLFTIYRRLGRADELEQLLSEAEKSLKSKPEILRDFRMRIGIASYNSGDFDTAESYFLTIWDTSAPSNIDGLVPLYYSKLLEERGSTNRAIEILEIYLSESDDRRAEILVRLAELYTRGGVLGRAESRLDEFFADYAESSFFYEAAYLKAFIGYKNERIDEALEWVSRAYSADSRGERTASLLRLESILLKQKGDYSAAVNKLVRYLDYQPEDTAAAMDLFRLRFLMNDYSTILVESIDFKWRDDVRSDVASYLLVSYISGLSAIAVSDYERAVDELSLISPVNTEDSGLSEIYPYALFYRGWALYRGSDYARAMSTFDELLKSNPDSPSAVEAAYLAGWCGYIMADYESSSTYFLKYSGLAGDDARGNFMYAKNLAALERYREAANIFAEITREDDESPLADDALFEKAALYALMGDAEAAASEYEYLFKKYGGRLAEEGMFRRGELYYDSGNYASAAAAYYDFRRNYPESSMYDAALYWGGMSMLANGEGFGAVLLWENIIEDYRLSIFRAPAMLKTAEVYAEADDYSSALAMYEQCRLEYPGTERAATAANESEKLRLLINGLSEREAELNVIITREGGAGSPEGRRAMIELAALYISMGGSDLKPAMSMLQQVSEHEAEDPEAAADARFYIGEYHYRQNNYTEAVKAFVETASINPADGDSSARALYRAADTAVLAGSMSDARELIKRLKTHYPGTEWAIEADKLLEEAE